MAGKALSLVKLGVEAAKPQLQIALRYAMAEMTPPKVTELRAVRAGFANLLRAAKDGAYLKVSVREAWLNVLVTSEVLCWFFVGECIGKGHIVGYDV